MSLKIIPFLCICTLFLFLTLTFSSIQAQSEESTTTTTTANTHTNTEHKSPLGSYFLALIKPKPSMCELKNHPGAYHFFNQHAQNYQTPRLEVSETGMKPRLLVFRDKMHRHKNIVDINQWSEDEVIAALNSPEEAKSDPPLVDMDLSDMSIKDIMRALEFYEIYPNIEQAFSSATHNEL
jgi:hypothetical protein